MSLNDAETVAQKILLDPAFAKDVNKYIKRALSSKRSSNQKNMSDSKAHLIADKNSKNKVLAKNPIYPKLNNELLRQIDAIDSRANRILAKVTMGQMQKQVVNYIKHATPTEIDKISDEENATNMLINVFCKSIMIDDDVSPYHKSILRGAIKRSGLIAEHGGAYDYKEVMQLTGWSKATISTYYNSKKLLGIKIDGKLKYPAFQFNTEGMIKGLKEVIHKLLNQTDDFWSAFTFLINKNDFLPFDKPITPLAAIKKGDVKSVLGLIESRHDQSGH